MRARQALRHPFSVAFGAAVGLYVGLALVAPETWLKLASKEGPLEHLGHALMLSALGVWAAVAASSFRERRAAAGVAAVVTTYLAFALMEEVDWGAVYGLDLGHRFIASLTGGSENFHNAQRAHGSVFAWALVWMSAPMAAYFAAPLIPLRAWKRRWERAAPARSLPLEGVLFFAAAAASVAIDSVPLLRWRLGFQPRAGAGDPIGAPLGLLQATFYLLWLSVALRALSELRAKRRRAV